MVERKSFIVDLKCIARGMQKSPWLDHGHQTGLGHKKRDGVAREEEKRVQAKETKRKGAKGGQEGKTKERSY